jgi:hypothetical protein
MSLMALPVRLSTTSVQITPSINDCIRQTRREAIKVWAHSSQQGSLGAVLNVEAGERAMVGRIEQ